MTVLGDRIRTLRKSRNWSEQKLALLAGVDRSYVHSVEFGTNRHPAGDKLTKLANALERPVDEFYKLIGYTSPAVIGPREDRPEELLERYHLTAPVSIPVYGRFHAGMEHDEIEEYIYWHRNRAVGKNIQAFRVDGHCLSPRIENGDIVIVDRDKPIDIGKYVLALVKDEIWCGKLENRKGALWIRNNDVSAPLKDCQASAIIVEVIKRME